MSTIYVIGHKNPDTDSISSAYSYAALKQAVDPGNTYLAARCGNANNQTKYIFQTVELPLPQLLKDVYPKVSDVMTKNVVSVCDDDPVLEVFHKVEREGVQVVPVVDRSMNLKGLVGEKELITLFIQEAVDQRPVYHFYAKHIPLVIKGEVLHEGASQEFNAAIMVGAMPMTQSQERIERAGADQTLLIVGNRKDVIEYAIQRNIPAIIITGFKKGKKIDADFSGYKGWVYLSNLDSAETVRRVILASPAYSIMSKDYISISENEYLEGAGDLILTSRQRLLPVLDGEKLTGVVTRANILQKFKSKLILVDHNEPVQAVDGVETAEVLEIVDHHRLGAVKTTAPVTFYAKPVGSTCTLVYQLYQAAGIVPEKKAAILMMSGILSDTIILKSPTTTRDDRTALEGLSKIAGLDWQQFGLDIFSATDNLSARTPENIVTTDFKSYSEYGVSFGVGQVEVVTLADLEEVGQNLLDELQRQKQINNIDWALLLITDIIKEESILLCTPFEAAEKHFTYRMISPHRFSLPSVLSRKKQLLPEILRILEDIS